MKRIFFFIVFINLIFVAQSQYSRASLWTSAMSNFAAQDTNDGVASDVVLFAGSSTFTMWTGLKTDFPNSNVLNRGFGGSMMTDLIYFFDQVVAPYSPKQVVLYEGDNDLYGTTKTADEFMDDVITMTRMINIYYPNAKILLVSIKPSPSRTSAFTIYQAANLLMKNYADKYEYLTYVDTWTPMLSSDGTPDSSLFGSDLLHMNATGYALWKSILEPYLLTSETINADISIFKESSHPYYHDPSWVNATAPSVFNTVQAGKISTDSTYHYNGVTSLKLDYQGVEGGNWVACVAATDWIPSNITNHKELEFRVYSENTIADIDLPSIYLESNTGTTTARLLLSSYIDQIPAGVWSKVIIPLQDWKDISPNFTYDNVKTIFYAQNNVNSSPIKIYVDDITFNINSTIINPDAVGDIFIDFGSNAESFLTPGNWNNISDTQSANQSLIDDMGDNSGITLKITDPFYNGYNTTGTATISAEASIFPGTATIDNFFGHSVVWGTVAANPLGEFVLSGLDNTKYYSFSIFASRTGVSDNREAKYTITGSTTAFTTLNSSNNTTEITEINNIQPNAQGEIIIKSEAGDNNNNSTKFFYLGAIKISIVDNPNAVKQISENDNIASYSNGVLKLNNYTGIVNIYDFTGKSIKTGQTVFGQFPVTLNNGTYIIKTSTNTSKLLVK
ncbi:MAG: GDSL-type esterase/lipase family protein [Paludibacter sp.]|nr:GDSL-type esterase/lipase family protein [Paludibacter sp.]